MCKKLLSVCLAIILVIGIAAVFSSCEKNASEQSQETTVSDNKETAASTENSAPKADSADALEAEILKYVEDEIAGLNTELTELTESINTYDKYVKNIDEVESYYEKVITTSYSISVRLREYSIEYAELLINSDMSADDMYDAFDGLYDCIYDDAADILYDGIYDDLMDDLYDAFYNGVISDGYDNADYSEWSDISSDAYDLWSDTSSDCYDHWSDMLSDVYGFWSDIISEVFDEDISGAKDEIADFKEDIEKLKA